MRISCKNIVRCILKTASLYLVQSNFYFTEFAQIIKDLVGGTSKIVALAAVEDDPHRRKPDISRAKKYLNWEPKISLVEGIKKTIAYFTKELQRSKYSLTDSYLKRPYKNDHDIIDQL